MAPTVQKGTAFLLLLLPLAFAVQSPVDRQEELLRKLDGLAETLSDAVSRLESALSDGFRARSSDSGNVPMLITGDRATGGEKKGVHVRKSKPLWLERFQLMAEVRLVAEPSCAAVLPFADPDGLSKYFALGDVRGRVLVFSSTGDLLIESETPSGSPVTAMLVYLSVRKNESFLFTGHADGSVVARKLWESVGSVDWLEPVMSTPHVFFGGSEGGELGQVELMEVHQAGRVRYLVCTYGEGGIRVFTENGMLFGVMSVSSRPLAFMKQRNFFLTEKGAGWLDLRRMTVLESGCEGLSGSSVKSYVFDASERSKAYGFTQEGHLIHVVLLGDGVNFKCRVRLMKKSEVDGNVTLLIFKGYLLAVNHERVFLYNVSSKHYSRNGMPKPVFVATLAELKSLFPDSDDWSTVKKPLVAGDRGKLIVVGLGGRYIGIYRPNFPAVKVQSNIVLWSSPALVFFMFLLGMWYLYAKKKGTMAWAPDESFVGAAGAAASGLLGPAGGDRAFGDLQRASDIRDSRGSVLRGPARRYTSPTSRFQGGGAAIPYRQSPADPGFTGAADLKFRSRQSVDSAVFPLRKDPVFSGNQAQDDRIE